jgi:hypothetical protein
MKLILYFFEKMQRNSITFLFIPPSLNNLCPVQNYGRRRSRTIKRPIWSNDCSNGFCRYDIKEKRFPNTEWKWARGFSCGQSVRVRDIL